MSLEDNKFLLYSVILSVTVGICYIRSLECGFPYDDKYAIVNNKDLRPHTPVINIFWNDFWGQSMTEGSHMSYRPLCVLTFRLNYWLSELEPMSYHLVNVVLHAVVCLMFMKACTMFLHEMTSFLAALLFAVHPIHTDAVTAVVGRAEALSSIFFLASLMTYARCTSNRRKTNWQSLFITIGLASISMLCKEQGITVIGICVVYELFVAQRMEFNELWGILVGMLEGKVKLPDWLKGSILRSLVLVGSTLFLLIARVNVMGAQLPVFTHLDNPAAASPAPTRHLTFNYLLPVNFWLLLCPAGLCCDWSQGTIPVIKSILDPRNLATVMFYTCLGKITCFALSKQGRLNRALIMCLALMVLPFIPASNLLFSVGFVVAERILYIPSMGFCMLVAVGFDLLIQHKKSLRSLLWILMAVLVATHAGKTYVRNIDWTSQYSLNRAALTVNKQNAKLWLNVGHTLGLHGKTDEALEYFIKAVSVQPDYMLAHVNLAKTLLNLKRYDEAEKAYERAKDLFIPDKPGKSYKVHSSHLEILCTLASLYARDPNRLNEADKLLKTAIDMQPNHNQAYIDRAQIMIRLGRQQDALMLYETVLDHQPDHPDVLYNIGVVYRELGANQQAYEYFEKSLAVDPDHLQSMYGATELVLEDGRYEKFPLTEKRLTIMMKKSMNDSWPLFALAMLSLIKQEFVTAEKYFRRAVELGQGDDKSDTTYELSLLNLATMLTNMERSTEAEPFLRTLLTQNPNNVKGLVLLGEISLTTLDDLEQAEQCFNKVVELESDNTKVMHSLCVVRFERGDLLRAEMCYSQLHQLMPEDNNILNERNIVRKRLMNNWIVPNQQKEHCQADQGPAGQDQAGQDQTDQGQADQDQASNSQADQGHTAGRKKHEGETES